MYNSRLNVQHPIASPARERLSLNDGWRFQKGDPKDTGDSLSYAKLKAWLLPTANPFIARPPAQRPKGAAPGEALDYTQPNFDDKGWRAITLPHDFGIEEPFDQALPGKTGKLPWFGIAWYRKVFDLPASDRGRQIFLEIDGAMSYSAVWCNGKFVGGWPYGYASYHLDLTPYLQPGASNTLAIRLDNPNNSSRWYPGGGIYRNIWLVKTAPVHVDLWGTYVTMPEVSAQSATLDIKVQVANRSAQPAKVRIVTHIKSPTGGELFAGEIPSEVTIDPNSITTASTQMTIPTPRLWDIQAPALYTAITILEQDGKIIDRYETPFGIRKVEFTTDDGFHLNGKRVRLQGVCMHHDLGALGAAFNTRAAERQLQILKEMGVNAIRTSHNPPAPELLDLCDCMGFLVMDEFSDTWVIAKNPNGYAILFEDWSEADMRAMLRRDRNHPSVVFWSIGNEIEEQLDVGKHHIAARLTAIAHEEDPTRPTTAGCNYIEAGFNGFQKCVDIFGYNYKPKTYREFHQKHPTQPILGSETASAISSRGEYFFPAIDKQAEGKFDFQVSSYDLYAPAWAMQPDVEFKGQDENPFVAGEFVWTGFDYLGEPTPYNDDSTNLLNYHTQEAKAKAAEELKALGKIKVPSRSSYFGIVDLAGFKKDRFYLYQAHWRPELPMTHILPHWNWEERMGEITPVHVYTSGDEVELFLNRRSLGRKKKAPLEYRLQWDDVRYEPGELKAIAYKDGIQWATDTVKTTGRATKLALTADRSQIQADGRDLSFVTLSVVDQNGLIVPRSKNHIQFDITGPGKIVATDNGDATDHTSFQSPERAAFNGLALVIVRAKPGATGPITLRATAEGLTGAAIVITASNP